ncbi:MAG: porin [Planctomycetota bacterium]|jgi:hypothetical protein
MMKKLFLWSIVMLSIIALFYGNAMAGAKITINDNAEINLGFRLQSLYLNTDSDIDGDGSFESLDDFKIRRARIRLGADVTQYFSLFLQTEFAQGAGSGGDVRLIDAFAKIKPHKLAHFVIGENMAPVTRQNLTSSGGLMTVDRPGITYKNLTWGARALSTFSNVTYGDSASGLSGDVDVRDLGVTLFGSTSFREDAHLKYYLGVYDGIQEAGEDKERFAGRAQFNFFDAEPNYYGVSTYLGKKKTIGVGAAFDTQTSVAVDLATGDDVDYAMYTFDVFADYPVGDGTLTFEAAFLDLDLDDATMLDPVGKGLMSDAKNAKQSQGDGWYVQAGYYINKWQPWVGYETWDSDASNDKGDFDALRVGLTYFYAGHNANIKIGYEHFKADEDFTGKKEDSIDTLLVGVYMTY